MKLKPLSLIATALAAALLTSTAFADSHAHWTYNGKSGAKYWGDMKEDFATCKLGKNQSPIDIPAAKAKKADLPAIGFAYSTSTAEVVNNGHTIQVNLPAGSKVTLAGAEYNLLQFHFHAPSEEKVNGKPYPMVAHFVHKNAEGKLAVVAVLFKQGKANAALKDVLAKLPGKEGDKLALDKLDPAAVLPANQAYYAFMGSLTTPPCSEEVRWQVLKTPVELSATQIKAFRKLYPMNARPVQPLNGREVQVSQ